MYIDLWTVQWFDPLVRGALMSQVFISYARSTKDQAQLLGKMLRTEGCDVWLDDALPAHRAYADVIEERLRGAKAIVVIWSSDAVKSQWVRAEADFARNAGTLVQLSIDGAIPPLPFNQIHCAQLHDWNGDSDSSGWRTILGSVRDLIAGVHEEAGSIAPALPDKPSIAVLPFANLSSDSDQEYFVAGMVDEIVMALTRIRTLFVISSESSLALREKDWDDRQAAIRMGVRYLLNGSVKKSGSRVRISVKLVDTCHDAQIWAERFEDDLEDVFELQDRIAIKVAGVIEPSIHEAEFRRVARQPVENLGCYDLYLRAVPLRAACKKAEVVRAIKLLDRALALDPDFAPALAQAAGCHSQMYANGWAEEREWHKKQGLDLAERAVIAGPEDASVLAQAANALCDLGGLARATALADRAISINPGCARAWFMSGFVRNFAGYGGDTDAAVERFQTASRLDPVSPLNDLIQVHIGMARIIQGDFQEALKILRTTTYRTARVHLALATLYGHMDMPRDSLGELALFEAASPLPFEEAIADGLPENMRAWIIGGINRAREASLEQS
jgi:adenylate cyclase